MDMTYEGLKQNVVKVETLNDFNLGDVSDQFDGRPLPTPQIFKLNNKDEIIIPKGTIVELCVQPFNNNYEIKLANGEKFDIFFEDDDEVIQNVKPLETVGPNKYFVK